MDQQKVQIYKTRSKQGQNKVKTRTKQGQNKVKTSIFLYFNNQKHV